MISCNFFLNVNSFCLFLNICFYNTYEKNPIRSAHCQRQASCSWSWSHHCGPTSLITLSCALKRQREGKLHTMYMLPQFKHWLKKLPFQAQDAAGADSAGTALLGGPHAPRKTGDPTTAPKQESESTPDGKHLLAPFPRGSGLAPSVTGSPAEPPKMVPVTSVNQRRGTTAGRLAVKTLGCEAAPSPRAVGGHIRATAPAGTSPH